jgi:sterol desaturase/sphingolipid hydroxylase (fatty acid hydroxylase superfamily)
MTKSNSANITADPGGYRPRRPIQLGPLYQRPRRLRVIVRWLFGIPGYFLPWTALFIAIAVMSLLFFTPDAATAKVLSADWVVPLFLGNFTLLVMFVGAQHMWLYARKAQGTRYKYTDKWLAEDSPAFLLRHQLWDNVLWNVCSAVPIWTAYESLTLWLQANGRVPAVSWQAHPIYCTALVLLTPLLGQIHFYATHRLLHWRPLYRFVHYVHHKNINFGPWSGLAMHPLEHVVFFSLVTLFWVIPAHPLHVVYMLSFSALSASLAHVGFARLVLTNDTSVNVDHYMHHLHHKYFIVNYGNDLGLVPFDKWFGTFHDGSEQAQEVLDKLRAGRFRRRPDQTQNVEP